ncbi:MAG TPA: hypothetical protein PKD45_09765 [Flavobacteriales bacterium]|nr:hypothetical protein [Flavobacteriales bacterium]
MKDVKQLLLSIWILGAVLLPLASQAQAPVFTNEAFLAEITGFLASANKKEGTAFAESVLAPFWNSGYLNDGQRARLLSVANVMGKKRFAALPDFKDMLATAAAFPAKGHTGEEFDAWLKAWEKAGRSSRKQDMEDLLKMGKGLLEANVLYETAGSSWYSRSGKFTFAFDSVPKVMFPAMDLVWASKTDSSVIEGTSGTYFPLTNTWAGKGGTITWRRAGLSPTATFVKWTRSYQLRLKTTEIVVDSVNFADPYFDRILLGTVTDKLKANVTETTASYPRFESYDLRKQIKDIVPGIDFEGGFAMQGAKLMGYGTKEEPASLVFNREGRPFILTKGLTYVIDPDKISSEDVTATLMLDKDSIYHPKVTLRFMREKKQLTLIKPDEGLSKGPFYDTYHKLDMYFEELRWKQGDPVVQLGNMQGTTQTRTSFESFNYFEKRRYIALLGIDEVHPLSRLRDFSKQAGDEFDVKSYALYVKLPINQVKPMLIDLANKGYLHYDPEEERVAILPRLRQHILSSAGRMDYDVLQFNSNSPDGVNGTINLLNNDLALKGVARITLSDSQDVKIYPADQAVTIKKDRDFSFGGMIKAGKLTFHGKEYYFHYEPFVIDLLNVDSVAFVADSFEPDENGRSRLVKVKNVLENVAGTLEVDAPSNKNGLQQEKYPEFPRFNSTRESFVFYDRKAIQKGAYKRDGFYYRSDPFVLDSLDNFSNEGLRFEGTLVSGGIFPDIRETLRLQPDYALGFVRPTGAGGLPLYGKKAKFSETLTLDNKGLHGNGDLSYLTTIAYSKDLYFTPDTTYGVADTLYNGAAYSATMNVPNVKAANVFLRLEPAADVLLARNLSKPMVMYDRQAYLHGLTELRPQGMTGAGLVDFTNATLSSRLFDFKTMTVHADTSDFRLTEGDTTSIAFRTDNVNATVKLDERVGEFVSNGDETKVEFPYNQYICYMDRFKWYMDQGDIELESDKTAMAANEDLQLSGSNFISVHPDQDSLRFMAPKARYDLKKHLITANEVQYIQVADALITPDSLRVRIGRNAKMDPLTRATVTANFVNKYHKIHDATVNIAARKRYSGSGIYDYRDETGKVFPIQMRNVNVDSTFQTYALGRVAQDEGFQLSPAFDFFGDVLLRASVKDLTFTGNTRIMHDCAGISKNWMGFTGMIDPAEVFIPVSDSLIDAEGFPVGAGMYMTKDDPFTTYGTFLSRKADKGDRDIISAKGLLFFDKAKKAYLISNKDKIRQNELPGNLVALNTENCMLHADGHISPGMQLGQVEADAYGTMEYNGSLKTTGAKVTLITDFPFLSGALDKMVAEMAAYPEQKQVDLSKTMYERSLREVLGKEKSDKLISELSIKGEIKRLPEELVKALVFCDLNMEWNAKDEAWQSTGQVGLGTVLKKPVYRYLKGKVEFQRKRSGDVMTVLLMLDEQTYWFFQYTRNYMYVHSSNAEFNTMISELKDDKRQFPGKKGMPDYQFMLTNKRKVDDFRDRFGL